MPEPAPGHAEPHPDLAGYVLGTLGPAESASFARHGTSCARCRAEVEELAWIPARLAGARPAADPPDRLRAQTLAAVAVDAAAARGRAPAVAASRPRWPLAAAAAAVAAIAGVAALAAAPSSDARPPRAVDLVAADGGAARGVAHLQRGPLGIGIRLVLEDVPAPPAGHFYECWYLAPPAGPGATARVSAGTFRTPASGRALVQMVTAADPARYPVIEITLEPDDGDPARTGPVVLRSRLTSRPPRGPGG